MKCPKCNIELKCGKVKRQKDGTEYCECKCPECRGRFMDIKIPKSVLEFKEEYVGE